MKKDIKILGVVPARAGSVGLKNKNILKINRKSLVERAIDVGLKSKRINKVIVTTDSKKIINIAKKKKIECIDRPKNLCRSSSKIYDVLIHALNFLKKKKFLFDYLVCLQPTTPLKTSKMIDEGIKKILYHNADSLVSVYKVEDNHPARMYKITNGMLKSLNKRIQTENRQKLNHIYHRDGNIYIFKVKSLLKNKTLYGKKNIPMILTDKTKLNIDNKNDFIYAKIIFKKK